MNEEESQMLRLQAALELLEPHFDAVQILATRYDHTSGTTVRAELGTGNWYARRGHAQEWMLRGDEVSRIEAADELASPGDVEEDNDAEDEG